MENLYNTFICLGPVGRTCLRTISAGLDKSEYQSRFRAYVNKLDNEIARGYFETEMISLMHPILDNTSYIPTIISPWIACRIVNHWDISVKESGYKIFHSLSHQSTLTHSAGWFFEVYANNWLRKGGTFEATHLSYKDSKEVLSLHINPTSISEARYFTTAINLAKQLKNRVRREMDSKQFQIYFQPRYRTDESFHGLIVKSIDMLILFKITMAPDQGVTAEEFHDILPDLPKSINMVCVVFIIPEDRVANYKRPRYGPADCNVTINHHKYTIKQFRLVLSDADLLSIAVPEQHSSFSKGKRKREE